jgi:hypothetical protein
MLHVLKRLLLVVVGYFVAVIIGLASVVVIYSILSSLPGAPSYFSAMSLSPLVVLIVPPVAAIVLTIVVMLTCVPAAIVALVAEFLALRQIWLHALAGAAIGAGAFIYASPKIVDAIEGTDWADLGIVAAAGAIGGLTYWLIAGRNAGFVRRAAIATAYGRASIT